MDLLTTALHSPLLAADLMNASDALDASQCLTLVRDNAVLLNHAAARKLEGAAASLKRVRNRWAHQNLTEVDIKQAIESAIVLFQLVGDRVAAEEARALGSPIDERSMHLTELLRNRASLARPLITYSQTISALGWPKDQRGRRDLYSRLTASGALGRHTGEPLLCALVVLGEDDELSASDAVGIPGGGFYWLIGIDRHATIADKRSAHRKQIERVIHRFAGAQ